MKLTLNKKDLEDLFYGLNSDSKEWYLNGLEDNITMDFIRGLDRETYIDLIKNISLNSVHFSLLFRIKILNFLIDENKSLDDLASLYKATKDFTEEPADDTIYNLIDSNPFSVSQYYDEKYKKVLENKRK